MPFTPFKKLCFFFVKKVLLYFFFFDNTHIYRKSNHIKVIRPVKTLFVQTFVQVLNPKRRDINHRGDVICTNSESKSI